MAVSNHLEAVIFDMDGTLVDNTPYHYKSWQIIFKKYGKGTLSKERYYTEISGVPILETMRKLFGDERDEAGLRELLHEKEETYKREYESFVKPVTGLENLLANLKGDGIKIALASSATLDDIDFIFDHVPVRQYFDAIIDNTRVSMPKPNPQIFLKAADELGADHQRCVVFEDSFAGIKAATSAGMKVVGITTAHPADELRRKVDLVINDFAGVSVRQLAALFR